MVGQENDPQIITVRDNQEVSPIKTVTSKQYSMGQEFWLDVPEERRRAIEQQLQTSEQWLVSHFPDNY